MIFVCIRLWLCMINTNSIIDFYSMDRLIIIPSGGSGKRMGAGIPKQYMEMRGIPIIIRTLKTFDAYGLADGFVIALNPDWRDFLEKSISDSQIIAPCFFVDGGRERQDSIYNALQTSYVRDSSIVLVHDAVRPFVSQKLIKNVIQAANEFGAALPGLTPKDTIKQINDDGFISDTINRDFLKAVQTPQGFRTEILLKAYENAYLNNLTGTDDASLVEALNIPVKIVPGDEYNIKITTKFDLDIAEKVIMK